MRKRDRVLYTCAHTRTCGATACNAGLEGLHERERFATAAAAGGLVAGRWASAGIVPVAAATTTRCRCRGSIRSSSNWSRISWRRIGSFGRGLRAGFSGHIHDLMINRL